MSDKNTLKKWFQNYLKPTQEQFWAWMDSYWHKSEKIPIENVMGLNEQLGGFATRESMNTKVNIDGSNIDSESKKALREKLDIIDTVSGNNF